MINYNNKRFKPLSSSKNSETTQEIVFLYKQDGAILTSNYTGANILQGHLIGLVDKNGCINMCYHQININDDLMTGTCLSIPKILPNGKIQLHETWQWTSGDKSKGHSILEEI